MQPGSLTSSPAFRWTQLLTMTLLVAAHGPRALGLLREWRADRARPAISVALPYAGGDCRENAGERSLALVWLAGQDAASSREREAGDAEHRDRQLARRLAMADPLASMQAVRDLTRVGACQGLPQFEAFSCQRSLGDQARADPV
jgi:hypothetical protein